MDEIVDMREEYYSLLKDIAYRSWLLNAGLHETYEIIMMICSDSTYG